MKDIMEKLKGVLVESDLSSLQESINQIVEVKVEEHKKAVDRLAEEFVEKKVSEIVEAKEKTIIEEYDGKFKAFQEDVLEKLDMFIESEVVGNISEELMEDVARVAMFKPIVEGVEKLFAEHYVALDTEGDKIVSKKDAEIIQLREMVEKGMEEIKELKQLSEKAAIKMLFDKKATGLTKTQRVRAWDLVEGWDFDKLQAKINTVISVVSENEEEEVSTEISEVNPDEYTDETTDETEGAGDESESAGDEAENPGEEEVEVEVKDEQEPEVKNEGFSRVNWYLDNQD